ncbi:MAG: glycosyl hydrolase, partial [Planctomycetes bacterium]|nr:glycosyl hydrolase [Planctomycetota bacterium]
WSLLRQAHAGAPVSYAMVDSRNGALWACLDHGHWGQKLQRSTDMGETWKETERPKYPDGEMQGAPIHELFGADFQLSEAGKAKRAPAVLSYMWCMAEGGKDKPKRLYIGTEPGGLFVSNDGGESWELVRGLWDHPSRLTDWTGGGRDFPAIHSIIVDPRDSKHVFVAISSAGVFETTDDGKTWTPRNKGMASIGTPDEQQPVAGHDPHCVVASPSNPDTLWQQNHGGIFRSTDGAKTWTRVSQEKGPARFGFPITADEKNPDVAWVVPAEADMNRAAIKGALLVCRTDDGGKTWKELRKGLPQQQCYDIVFRHALDISGDRLAFASTTGNLYISEDRGESWQCAGNNFPPVYSVRFAKT